LEHSIGPVFTGQAAQEEFREHFGTQLYREWCGRGLKSQKSEDLREAVYFGNHMKGTITLFDKTTELSRVKLLCSANGSKTTTETVSTKRLYKVALRRRKSAEITENGTDIQLQCTRVMQFGVALE
jgi:hypothetical protein